MNQVAGPTPGATRTCPDCEEERPDFEFFVQVRRALQPIRSGACIKCFLADRDLGLPERLKRGVGQRQITGWFRGPAARRR